MGDFAETDTDALLREIEDLNLAYLLMAQRLLREDRAIARFRLHLADDDAKTLADMPARDLARIARCGQFIFRLGFERDGTLADAVRDARGLGLQSLHTALLLADTKSGAKEWRQ